MYANHCTTPSLALRAKWSFYSDHRAYGSQSYLFAFPKNPRFIYCSSYLLRRHSPLFQIDPLPPPPPTLLLPRRTAAVCDGRGLDEVIGLLAGSRRCCRCCCKGEGFAEEDADFDEFERKEGSWRRKAGSSDGNARRLGAPEVRKYEDEEEDDRNYSSNARRRKEFGRRVRDYDEVEDDDGGYWRGSGRGAREERYRNGRAMTSRRKVRVEDGDYDDRGEVRDGRYSKVGREQEYVREVGFEGRNRNERERNSRRKVNDRIIRVEDEDCIDWREKRFHGEQDQDRRYSNLGREEEYVRGVVEDRSGRNRRYHMSCRGEKLESEVSHKLQRKNHCCRWRRGEEGTNRPRQR